MRTARRLGVGAILAVICGCGISPGGIDAGDRRPIDAAAIDAGSRIDGGDAPVDGGGARPFDGGGDRISFSDDVQPILAGSCVFSDCHGAPGEQAGLNLSRGRAYENLVGVESTEGCGLRVTPGASSSSYLAAKLTWRGICYGSMMPLGGSIDASQVKTILEWIDEGAPEN